MWRQHHGPSTTAPSRHHQRTPLETGGFCTEYHVHLNLPPEIRSNIMVRVSLNGKISRILRKGIPATCHIHQWVSIIRDLKQTRTATPTSGGKKYNSYSSYFTKHIFTLVTFVCFYFRWNSVDSSVSSSTKRWPLVLEMPATFWRQRENGAVEVSFDCRTAQMSALFHIFTCDICLLFCFQSNNKHNNTKKDLLATHPSGVSSFATIYTQFATTTKES